MDLVLLVLVVALIGLLVWLITTRIQMPPYWAATLQLLALVVVILYVLSHFVRLPNLLPR